MEKLLDLYYVSQTLRVGENQDNPFATFNPNQVVDMFMQDWDTLTPSQQTTLMEESFRPHSLLEDVWKRYANQMGDAQHLGHITQQFLPWTMEERNRSIFLHRLLSLPPHDTNDSNADAHMFLFEEVLAETNLPPAVTIPDLPAIVQMLCNPAGNRFLAMDDQRTRLFVIESTTLPAEFPLRFDPSMSVVAQSEILAPGQEA